MVGLGNPDRSFAHNRHNIGFMCISRFARRHGIELKKKHCRSRVGVGKVGGVDIVVAKPQTYMNASGEAVAQLVDRYRIALEDILVVHDDLDLPLGRIRLRSSGSSGGHKGLKSIVAEVGSEEFARLKVGIGRPERDSGIETVVGYVLGDFKPDESGLVEEVIERAVAAMERFVTRGITMAMNEYNAPSPCSRQKGKMTKRDIALLALTRKRGV
ncbi:MAG: aminoacyl-tRNA hydrolase [Chloroflexota bacterium]